MNAVSPDSALTGEAVVSLRKTIVPKPASWPSRQKSSDPARSAPRIAASNVKSHRQDASLRALRQGRLRAAACYLSIWWSVIAIQSLLFDLPYILPFLMVFALSAAYVHLCVRPKMADLELRLIEAGLFGLMAAAFIVTQCVIMVTAAHHSDYHSIEVSTKNALINSVTLLLAYTLLIPNTLRSATPIVLGLALYPLVTTSLVILWHPDVRALIEQHRYLEPMGLNLTMTIIAGTLSLYGVHVLDTLRQDVFEARRLNQYQLGERLGAGGMGEVYLAEHRLLRRTCAVKMVRPEKTYDRRALILLEREVRSTAQLSHPNIVEIYDYGRADDGSFYYVMERLRGLNLAELVQHHGPLPVSRIIYLLRQACDGLADAHAAGLVHRDLKPDNIFAAQVGRRFDVAKLLDFGLVKQSTLPNVSEVDGSVVCDQDPTVTISGALMGTPLFMAPEQGFGDQSVQDHRADLYSLGAIAYFLVTGQPPFEGRNPLRIMTAHAHDPVLPPSHLLPVPDDFERVILRCLEKRPADRYSSAEDLERALSECDDAGEWDSALAAEWWTEHHHLMA